jgi:hypothetical protein
MVPFGVGVAVVTMADEDASEFDLMMDEWEADLEGDAIHATNVRTPRSVRRKKIFVLDQCGDFYKSVPTMSLWYALYIDCLDVGRHFQKVFWNRFQLPYKSFIELPKYLKLFKQFQCWNSKTATGEPSSPITLLLLSVLRVLGCASTFDDLQEVTSISGENHRQFMHVFIAFASTI